MPQTVNPFLISQQEILKVFSTISQLEGKHLICSYFTMNCYYNRISVRQNNTMSQRFPVIVAFVNALVPTTGVALCWNGSCKIFEIAKLHYWQPPSNLSRSESGFCRVCKNAFSLSFTNRGCKWRSAMRALWRNNCAFWWAFLSILIWRWLFGSRICWLLKASWPYFRSSTCISSRF